MSERLVLGRSILRKVATLQIRYPVDTLSNLAIIYIVFLIAFFGGQALNPEAIAGSTKAIIVGFFLFLVASVAYGRLGKEIVREAQWGTLEQLYMTPLGFGTVIGFMALSNILLSFLYGIALLALMMVTTGEFLAIDLLTALPLAVLTLASAVSLGLILGGVALVYKRVEYALQIVQYAFVGLIAAPVESIPVLKALPIALGSHLLLESMTNGTRLWELPTFDLAFLVVKAVVYLAVGYLALRYSTAVARERGVLGHY